MATDKTQDAEISRAQAVAMTEYEFGSKIATLAAILVAGRLSTAGVIIDYDEAIDDAAGLLDAGILRARSTLKKAMEGG